jgi:hypothetical protein
MKCLFFWVLTPRSFKTARRFGGYTAAILQAFRPLFAAFLLGLLFNL